MPSLYESTAIVGEVSSSNFTTLYNSSGLSAPNSGGGAVSGNLNVSGNLTVQGASLLQGAVVIGSTLSTPNYTFPLPDGTTDQVLVTDGSGNLYWTDVSAIPGAAYSIEANTATGGANLTLVDSAGGTDNVKFAGGTNITVSRTDANTITISTVADNIPDGTGKGQVLYWDGSAWTANSTITFDSTTYRPRFVNNITNGITSADFLKQYTTSITDGAQVGQIFGFYDGGALSSTNPRNTHRVTSEYDTTNNYVFSIQADPTNNFTTGTTYYRQLRVDDNYLGINGNQLVVNTNLTGAPTEDGVFRVNRGTSTDATLTWNETDDRWDFNNNVLSSGWLGAQADVIYINWDNTAIDSYLSFKGINNEYIKWNNTDSRFEFSDQIYNSQTDIPAVLERQVTSATTADYESRTSLRLTTRVTDAANNDTINTGPAINFSRTSGATDPTEKIFAGIVSVWDGTQNKATTAFNWTNDNYTEISPGLFPETYNLLRLTSKDSEFFNNSLYINYNVVTNTETATSITGGNTLVFGSAHGYTAGQQLVFQSASQNGLKLSSYYYVSATGLTSTQCQVTLTAGGSSVPLTNGTGLTLTFAEVTNRVGVNTDNPGYTLDVNGDANVSGDIYVSGVHIDLTTPVHQGQFLYVSNDVTPTITNSSLIPWTSNTYRPNFQGDAGIYGRSQTGAAVTNNTGAVNYTTGDGSGLLVGVDSDGQTTTYTGSLSVIYNASGEHAVKLTTTTNNFNSKQATSITGSNTLVFPAAHGFSIGDKLIYAGATQNGLTYNTTYYVIAAGFTTTQCQVSLTLGGSVVALTNGTGLSLWFYDGINRVIDATNTDINVDATNLVFNSSNTGIPGVDASIEVERGTSGSNVEILWNETTDRWTTTTNGSTYLNIPNQNLDTTDAVAFSAVTIDSRSTLDTTTLTTTSTSTVSLVDTNRNLMKVVVNIIQGANVHCVEALVLRTGASTAMLTTYGEMYNTTSLASFTADVSGGNIRLLVTPTSSTSTVFTTVRTSLT